MAASKAGLTYEKSQAYENEGDITWCKYVCRFPAPRTYGDEYRIWQNTMKRKMEQDRILDWKQSSAAQWAAIQAHALTLPPITVRAGLWQSNTDRGTHFTECLSFFLKDIAKKHQSTLAELLEIQPVVAPAATPAAAPAATHAAAPSATAPGAIGNDRLTGPHSVRVWLEEPSKVRPDDPLPAGLHNIQWQTHEHVYWIEDSDIVYELVRPDRERVCCLTILRSHYQLVK
ncbi:hypothetical protein L873DRAFT_1849641 [Choiromyces venosus 120613-1]|uniref:Uncharacterized protein n=1 Tax=Choiromyces venosus 120613-1 TaxID=1336337 RepID=A0A3N4ISD2_9PEZI|nr:hypothetical protein L873DRAFT_1849641 [Choiromyces venosus 120613-1]